MSHIKQIFLDLDGPLLDGKEKHYHCYRSILESFGFIPIGIDEYWNMKRALVNRTDLLDMSGAQMLYDDFLTDWLSMIESPDVLALDKVQDGAIDCLHKWKKQGITLTLVTMRKNKQALEDQLKMTGLRQFLDAVLVCNHADGGTGKADAVQTFFHGRINMATALWIGDTESDWEAANALGCDIFLVTNGLRCEKYLEALKYSQVVQSITLINLPHE